MINASDRKIHLVLIWNSKEGHHKTKILAKKKRYYVSQGLENINSGSVVFEKLSNLSSMLIVVPELSLFHLIKYININDVSLSLLILLKERRDSRIRSKIYFDMGT